MMTIEVLKDGVIRLPKEVTGSLGIRAGDRLECIYGTRQIGLCPLSETGMAKTIFPPKAAYQLFWKICHVSGGKICTHCKSKGGGTIGLPLRIRTAGKKGTGGGGPLGGFFS